MNVLVVAPHPDDEAVGCGGTILRHAEVGDRVEVAFLTSGELSSPELPAEHVKATREREAQAAAKVLAVADLTFLRRPDWGLEDDLAGTSTALSSVVERATPDRVYVPHAHESHPDHRAAFQITSRALAGYNIPPACVLAYEVWTPLRDYTVVEDISEQMARKVEAIGCYRSQLDTFDYVQAASGLNRYRGALAAHTAFAEVFDGATNRDQPWRQ